MKLMIVSVASGWLVALLLGVPPVEGAGLYLVLVYSLLGAGLYLSTRDIDLGELRRGRSTVIMAVTLGVVFKVLFIGGALYLITGESWYFLVAVVVAQIDPLAVAALTARKGRELSERAGTILRAWSSFDDPMTVLASVYVASVLVLPSEPQRGELDGRDALALAFNFLMPLAVYLLMKIVRLSQLAENLVLLAIVVLAVYFRLMLGIALVGLIFRPKLLFSARLATQVAFSVSLFLVGMFLVRGVAVVQGVLVGACAVLAQVIVALALTRHLPTRERFYLAFAQQNGITAVLLALFFESYLPAMVGTVIPAIIFINIVHQLLNLILDRTRYSLSSG